MRGIHEGRKEGVRSLIEREKGRMGKGNERELRDEEKVRLVKGGREQEGKVERRLS